jgi:D-alanine-D-alanine ligase
MIRLAVLMGGDSAEREVSLSSGAETARHADPAIFQINCFTLGRTSEILGLAPRLAEEADVVFLALHGGAGENGLVQAALEAAGVPYTASGVLASALAMDKWFSLAFLAKAGLNVPRTELVRPDGRREGVGVAECEMGWPRFVKPRDHGSSVGVSKVEDESEEEAAIRLARQYSDDVLVQAAISGVELAAGVLSFHREEPFALPVVEIAHHDEFYTYDAKYVEGRTDEIVPARIPRQAEEVAKAAGVTAHTALGCRGMSRLDLIYDGSKLWVLEINTIPGLTPTSLIPRAAQEAGINFSQLIEHLVADALSWAGKSPAGLFCAHAKAEAV